MAWHSKVIAGVILEAQLKLTGSISAFTYGFCKLFPCSKMLNSATKPMQHMHLFHKSTNMWYPSRINKNNVEIKVHLSETVLYSASLTKVVVILIVETTENR